MDYKIREMKPQDYAQMMALWKATEGMGFSDSDECEPTTRFIEKNSDLCFVCEEKEKIIGTVLCGSDARRAYIYHLAVDKSYRRQGIASILVEHVHEALKKAGILKCGLFIFETNTSGMAFWNKCGFAERVDLKYYQTIL